MSMRDFFVADGRRAALARSASLLTLLALVGAGCGDDGGDGGGDAGAGDKAYVISTIEISTDGRVSYIQAVPSLEVESIDLANAIEFAGNVVTRAHGDSLYVGLAEEPVMVRYGVNDAGQLVETGSMNLSAHGFTRIPFGIEIASDTRAFFVDDVSQQLVVWNPSTMTVEPKTIDLTGYAIEGYSFEFWTTSAYEGRLYVPIRYANWETETIAKTTKLLIVDIETLEVLGVAEDDRCYSGGRPVFTDNGDAYVLADGRSGAAQLYAYVAGGGEAVPSNCVLRIKAGEFDFDADYLVETVDLLGGEPDANGVYPDLYGEFEIAVGGSGQAFVRGFDPKLLPEKVVIDGTFAYWSTPSFPLYSVELGDEPVITLVEELEPAAMGWTGTVADGKYYICQGESVARCTAWEIDPANGAARPMFEVPGTLGLVARLR